MWTPTLITSTEVKIKANEYEHNSGYETVVRILLIQVLSAEIPMRISYVF